MKLLLVDDDITFAEVLSQALIKRGYEIRVAHSVDEAITCLTGFCPEYAIVDLKMPGDSGLQLVKQLHEINNKMKIVMLTGYASITTAVEAIKLGATQYLTKPADADDIVNAFNYSAGKADVPIPDERVPLERLEWEYIQKILIECEGNISAAARKLGLHRRTLQRKLLKRPAGME